MDPESLKSLSSLPLDLDSIGDPDSRSSVVFLTNLIEDTVKEIQQLKEENQLLRDEISRLKGEQGRPKIRPQKKDGNISSESERNKNNEPKPKKSKEKKSKIIAHDEKICRVDKTHLPSDAEFKGYETLVVQDIIIKPHNTAFKREVYYSPSLKKRFIGDLPPGYESEFGPEIKTLILCLCHDSGMSQPNIHRFLKTIGIHISPATISRTLTDNQSVFHEEKAAIVNAALRSSSYQHIDDTGARVNGKNYCCHVLCNPFYTAYFTRAKKDRLTLLEILSQKPLVFQLNEEAFELIITLGLSEKQQKRLAPLLSELTMDRAAMDDILQSLYPNPKKQATIRRRILEACALTAFYHEKKASFPILVCDDAPQFKGLTELLALCWVHEGRHYKRLKPLIPMNQIKVEKVLTELWDFYHQLLAYKENPSALEADYRSNGQKITGQCA